MPTRIQVRRDTSDRWESVNPVLGIGEPGYDLNEHALKIGDGYTRWADLPGYLIADASGTLPASVLNQLGTMFATLPPRNARAASTLEAKMSADGLYEYEVLTVRASGRAVNDLVEKVYPGDYEKSWSTGAFAPGPATDPRQLAREAGAFALVSGDAYESSKMTGVQIKNGVLYSGWGSASATPTGLGVESLAFMKDGSWRVYRQAAGDTPEKMVADGVDTTYGFGPVVVENGSVRDIESDATWAFFAQSVSARTILGRRTSGDVVFITVKGKSSASGIKGNAIGQLALVEGCSTAILLDGGGTTQGIVAGRTFHPSSDIGGVRNLRCAIAIRAPLTGPARVDEVAIAYANGAIPGVTGNPMVVSKVDNRGSMRGTAGIMSATANTWYTVGQLPERFRPDTTEAERFPIYGNQNGYAADLSISADGTVLIKFPVVAASGSASWVQLSGIDFRTVY